jgi:hypothetical protein
MAVRSAEVRIATYDDIEGGTFRISEIDASLGADAPEVLVCAAGIRDVLLSSYRQKFVPSVLSEASVQVAVPSVEEQAHRIVQPTRQARYLIACVGEQVTAKPEVRAFIRVETYKPRMPLKRSYPNVTDLETGDGLMRRGTTYHSQAVALLQHGLDGYPEGTAVSAYTERPNTDGRMFYTDCGLSEDPNMSSEALTQQLGDDQLTYVHMSGATIAVVRQQLSAG